MKIPNKRTLITTFLVFNALLAVVIALALATTGVPEVNEDSYKVKIAPVPVKYTPFIGWSIGDVKIEQQKEGIKGLFYKEPMTMMPNRFGFLTIENIEIRLTLGDCIKSEFSTFSKLGDTKEFEFECRNMPIGQHPMKIEVIEGSKTNAEFTRNLQVGI